MAFVDSQNNIMLYDVYFFQYYLDNCRSVFKNTIRFGKNETQKYCILLYVIPIFLLVDVNCMEKYNNLQFTRIVRWILIAIYLLIYYIYQK